MVLDLGELSIDDIGVELVAMMKKEEKIEVCFTQEFVPVSFENGKAMYSIEVTPDDPGIFMTNIFIEYARIMKYLEEKGYNITERMHKIEELSQISQYYRF